MRLITINSYYDISLKKDRLKIHSKNDQFKFYILEYKILEKFLKKIILIMLST